MADVALIKTAAEQQLAAEWQQAARRLPGPTLLRATAFERFAAAGLPSRRIEEWKYTDLRALMREAKPLAAPPDAAARARAKDAGAALASIEARRIVFVDGAFVPELSDLGGLEPGLTIRSMAEVLTTGDPRITAALGSRSPDSHRRVEPKLPDLFGIHSAQRIELRWIGGISYTLQP